MRSGALDAVRTIDAGVGNLDQHFSAFRSGCGRMVEREVHPAVRARGRRHNAWSREWRQACEDFRLDRANIVAQQARPLSARIDLRYTGGPTSRSTQVKKIIALVVVVLLLAGFGWFAFVADYSDGYRVGQVIKLSRSGVRVQDLGRDAGLRLPAAGSDRRCRDPALGLQRPRRRRAGAQGHRHRHRG